MATRTTRASWADAGGHRTLAEKAFASLHDAILNGELTPGERLLIEELAEQLDMSPMPIREALRRLDAVGLVELLPHKAARVTELSVEDLAEVYEARLALEPLAVRAAAARFTDEAPSSLRSLARHVRLPGRRGCPAAWAAHTAFHFALYHAAGSRWLIRLITPLWETSERYRIARPVQRSLDERKPSTRRSSRRAYGATRGRRCGDVEPPPLTANLLAGEMGRRGSFRAIGSPRHPA